MNVTIHHDLGHPDAPARAALVAAAIGGQAEQALLGHTDFHYRADTLAAYSHDEDESQLIILCDEAAFLHVFLPRSDNVHTVDVQATVLPGRDPLPLLDALYPAFQDLCRQERRTAITWWEYSRQEEPTLTAATDSGAVEATPVTDWLQERGFVLDQVEVTNTLQLPVTVGRGTSISGTSW